MQIGAYRINLDALLARMVYRWRVRVLGAMLLLVALVGLLSGLIPPFWNGRATAGDYRRARGNRADRRAQLAAPGLRGPAYDSDNNARWPSRLVRHRATCWSGADAHAPHWPGDTTRALPASRSAWHAYRAGLVGRWRLAGCEYSQTRRLKLRRSQDQPTPTSAPSQTIAVGRQGVERLTTLDAYAGLADQVHRNSQLIEAVYRPNPSQGFSDQALGSVEVRGWSSAVQTIPISAPLTLLRFAPDGAALLAAERVPSGGEQLFLLRPGQSRVPLVAVPGRIARLSWYPDSTAVVIHSIQGERLTLTVVRLAPTIIAAVVADLDATKYAGAIVPLTWDSDRLLWVALDQQGISALWSAPLTSLIPERSGDLEARAIWYLPDGTLRVLLIQDEEVVIGRYQGDIFIGEAMVPRVPAVPDLMGMWHDGELLLQAGDQVWLLDIVEQQ